MRCLWIMFVTAVCFLFLLKLKWPKNKKEDFFSWTRNKDHEHVTVQRLVSLRFSSYILTNNSQ